MVVRTISLFCITLCCVIVSICTLNAGHSWIQMGSDIDGESLGDQTGYSVSLSDGGTVLAIGEIGYDDGTNSDAGRVRVFSLDGSTWTKMGNDIIGENSEDESGTVVSLSGNGKVVAIGAADNDGVGGTDVGHVRVFSWSGSAWIQMGNDIDGENDDDGSSMAVSLSGDGSVVAIGARRNYLVPTDPGYVRVFSWNGSAWIQMGSDIDSIAASDSLGRSVSLSHDGSVIAMGGGIPMGSLNTAGLVRVYSWNGSAWIQMGSDIVGEAAYDNSGSSVSLNADGSIVAIGAPFNDETSINAGHVRVFTWNGSEWAQMGSDIDGEADSGNNFGISVSLSADGSIVAIGANGNDSGGNNAGHVRVYCWNGTDWAQMGSDINGDADFALMGQSVSLSEDGSIVAIGGNGHDFIGIVRVYNLPPNPTGSPTASPTTNPTTNPTASPTFIPCPAGMFLRLQFSEQGTTNTCDICPPGTISPAGATICTVCPGGTYSSYLASECTACPVGHYSLAGASTCAQCAAGSIPAPDSASCEACPTGEYSYPGGATCLSCTSA